MFCAKLVSLACVLLLALGTAESQYKNPRGFIEQEDKMDYKDMIIKKLLMRLNDLLRERRPSEGLQQVPPRPCLSQQQQLMQPKPLIQQGVPQHAHIQQIPAQQIRISAPCFQQPHMQQLQQLPHPQIHQIQPQVRSPALKHAQTYARVAEQQEQSPGGCQYEYEEVQCPCEECPCCQDVQYEEVPCPCCEQQQPCNEGFASGNLQQSSGGQHVIQGGHIFTETFVSPPGDRCECESSGTETCPNCCMSQAPIMSTQRCSHCTEQPHVKAVPRQQPQQQQPQQTQQVIMIPGRPQVQAMLPQTLHPSFFTGFTSDDQRVDERIIQKSPFMHPKLNELLHASHRDTC